LRPEAVDSDFFTPAAQVLMVAPVQDNCNEIRGLISQAADRNSNSSKGSAFPSENSGLTKYEN
jgi:hypothetical protein